MDEIIVTVDDVKKVFYFLTALTQSQGNHAMQGDLSSKADFMGGILDRWINVIPESLLFNKILLKKISNSNDLSVITDFYFYNPQEDKAGIAPDVIGIKYKKKIIPFAVFDEHWKPVPKTPQIEVKSFKNNQKMVSLRNQHYEGKYLVLALTDFWIDYIVPFINKQFYDDSIYEELAMNDSVFIKSNKTQQIRHTPQIDYSDNSIGKVKLLRVTTTEDFINTATYCGPRESIEYFDTIEEAKAVRNPTPIPLSKLCQKTPSGLFRFTDEWYKYSPSSNSYKTTDIYLSDVDKFTVLTKSKSSVCIEVSDDCICGNTNLHKGKRYRIKLSQIDRSGNKGTEYFLLKTSINNLANHEKDLLTNIRKLIK